MARDPRQREQAKKMVQIVARAWSDDAFKERLVAHPRETLAEHGISVPAGTDVRVLENTETVTYIVIPPKPADGEVAVEQLTGIVAGVGACQAATCGACQCCRPEL